MVCQILKHKLKPTFLQHSVFLQNEKHTHMYGAQITGGCYYHYRSPHAC